MPLRSMKMNFFILGFHLRVWCPKWTPASRSSFIPISANGSSGLQPPLLPPARPPIGGPVLRSGACVVAGPKGFAPRPALFLPLRELEPLAGRGLPVLLPLLHPRVAREKPFLAQGPAKRGVDPEQRPRDSQADRPRLSGRAAAADVRDQIVLVGVVARYEGLQCDPAQGQPREKLIEVPAVDRALARALGQAYPRDRGFAAACSEKIAHVLELASWDLEPGVGSGRGDCAMCGC